MTPSTAKFNRHSVLIPDKKVQQKSPMNKDLEDITDMLPKIAETRMFATRSDLHSTIRSDNFESYPTFNVGLSKLEEKRSEDTQEEFQPVLKADEDIVRIDREVSKLYRSSS